MKGDDDDRVQLFFELIPYKKWNGKAGKQNRHTVSRHVVLLPCTPQQSKNWNNVCKVKLQMKTFLLLFSHANKMMMVTATKK